MGQATITLNGRTYRLRCGDGEEARLIELASHVHSKIERLANEFGQIGDDRLMVMAALLITDELFEARARLVESQPVDPSLFEPLPDIVSVRAQPEVAGPRPAPEAVKSPPANPPPQPRQPAPSEPDGQTESSLKRAIKRPQGRQSLGDRLADARDAPPPPERAPPRKTG